MLRFGAHSNLYIGLQWKTATCDLVGDFHVSSVSVPRIEIDNPSANGCVHAALVVDGIKGYAYGMDDDFWTMRGAEFITRELQSASGYPPQSERKESNSNSAYGGKSAGVLIEGNGLAAKKDSNPVKGGLLFLGGLFGMCISYATLIRRRMR
jgi:hypothetical protein